jgi:hypothetical protein
MTGVFQNIKPQPPLTARRVCTPRLWCGGGHTCWVKRGWAVNILEDARHCSVLYICKCFVDGGRRGKDDRKQKTLELLSICVRFLRGCLLKYMLNFVNCNPL